MTAEAAEPRRARVDHEHPDVTGGWLRPAVFGAMDGLVSNLALIAGVAGGTRDHADSSAVVLAGLAGLAAGAFSMAAGEYTSVASQSEAAAARDRQGAPRDHRATPTAETAELAADVRRRRGSTRSSRPRWPGRSTSTSTTPSPCTPARSSASTPTTWPRRWLAAGVVVPVLRGRRADPGAALPARRDTACCRGWCVTLLALFVCGAVVTQVTSRTWWYGGLRQMLLGAAAAGG